MSWEEKIICTQQKTVPNCQLSTSHKNYSGFTILDTLPDAITVDGSSGEKSTTSGRSIHALEL